MAGQSKRLNSGGRVDRSKPIRFRFNGRQIEGFSGDTLASALLANGISVVGRSFKLHRPRGIVGSGAEEPNAIMQIGKGASTRPNLRATQVELYDGLIATSTKGWPSVNYDLAAINNVFGQVFSAGFYYKTFMRPQALWHWYEKNIRRSAGFGRAPKAPDPDTYEHRNAHCDVLIAGAGPAGLMAALAAGQAGARVIIADEQNEFGGSLLASNAELNGQHAAEWLRATMQTLTALDNAARYSATSIIISWLSPNAVPITCRWRSVPARGSGHGVSVQSRSYWHRALSSDRWCFVTTTDRGLCWRRQCQRT